jgi:hypothetical protein
MLTSSSGIFKSDLKDKADATRSDHRGSNACILSPVKAQQGPAYPSPGSARGRAFPKHVPPTGSNPTNWVDISMNTQIRTGQIQEDTTGMAGTTTTTTINTDSVADAVHDGEYAMSRMGQELPRRLLISVSAKGHLLRGLDAASFDRIPAQSH